MNLFEANIVFWIQENLRHPALDPVVTAITSLGNGGIFWILLTVLLLLFKKTRKIGICCALGLIFDLLAVNIVIKPLVGRVRPYVTLDAIVPLGHLPGDHSFPSGHSAGSFAAAWALYRSARRRYGVPALVLAALIALSRLYVGVHYPTDVLAGIVIGILVGELGARAGKRIWKQAMRALRRKQRRRAKKA